MMRKQLLLLALAFSMGVCAQVVNVYKGDSVVGSYKFSEIDSIVFAKGETAPSHEYVEIGGLKWATMNVGATTVAGDPATCYGDYFAWGETVPRYKSITIKDGETATFGGMIDSHKSGYASNDYPTYTGETLDAAHDAATQNFGAGWRTPTKEDFLALVVACTGSTKDQQLISTISSSTLTGGVYWLYSTQEYLPEYQGVNGVLFVDKADPSKRVFFPFSGFCMGSELYSASKCAYCLSSSFYTYTGKHAHYMLLMQYYIYPSEFEPAYYGYTVRPVSD